MQQRLCSTGLRELMFVLHVSMQVQRQCMRQLLTSCTCTPYKLLIRAGCSNFQ